MITSLFIFVILGKEPTFRDLLITKNKISYDLGIIIWRHEHQIDPKDFIKERQLIIELAIIQKSMHNYLKKNGPVYLIEKDGRVTFWISIDEEPGYMVKEYRNGDK